MADNTAQNGTSNIATDDIAGVHFQRVKVTYGDDGSATDASLTNPLPVGGNVAHDAADSGNPVKVGGYYSSGTVTSVASGDRVDLRLDPAGNIRARTTGLQLTAADTFPNTNIIWGQSAVSGADSQELPVAGGYFFNGASWDRVRGDTTAGAWVQAKAIAPTVAVTTTDRSGSITTGGTAQNAAAANASRRGMTLQNTSSGDLRVTENGVAATLTTGYKLAPNASAQINSQAAISVIGATTGQTFAATEW